MSNKRSLDAYLEEVYKQFISIKDNDFKRAQEVFKSVFEQVKQKIGEQCNFFSKYSSQVMYSGSVYDGTKVGKMDEFDMDIVIRLPINYEESENGIIIENDKPGYVKLKIVNAFDNLDKQKEWENCHKVTRDWRDTQKYFLQNKFRHWMHRIIQRALNEMDMKVIVNDVVYLINYKASGPAYTLFIRNQQDDEQFQLDVDLVPVIRFMSPRWPKGYRTIGMENKKMDWFVVPKPNKALENDAQRNRCWRLSFHEHEREMLKEYHQLKKTIRLMKKLRNALNMKPIASYYIKTLFLWKIEKNKKAKVDNKEFWQKSLSFLFRTMLGEFHDAITNKKIPYFWNENNNLIEQLKPAHQKQYAGQLKAILQSIEANDVLKTVFALLTQDEIEQFMSSELYLKHAAVPPSVSTPTKCVRSCSTVSNTSSLDEQANSQTVQMDQQTAILKAIMKKIDLLTQKVEIQEERLIKLEEAHKQSQEMKLESSKETTRPENVAVLMNAPVPEIDANVLISF